MELLFNLVWVALSLFLITLWVRDCRDQQGDHGRVRLIWQLTALAVLIMVLLPVISMSDDLQACATPAEVEHFARRSDMKGFLDAHVNPLPLAIFAAALFVAPSCSTVYALPQDTAEPPRLLLSPRTATGIRPPPSLA